MSRGTIGLMTTDLKMVGPLPIEFVLHKAYKTYRYESEIIGLTTTALKMVGPLPIDLILRKASKTYRYVEELLV